jgi:type II secretory pathway pseudopilin PulG
LIELLVVISVMALLAALVVGMARHASDSKKLSRVQAEMVKWINMIDAYHDKLGFYPPSNPSHTISAYGSAPVGLAVTPLVYELSGADRIEGSDPVYVPLNTKEPITNSVLTAAFGVPALANASTEKGEAVCFARSLQATEVLEVDLPGVGKVKLPKVPVIGPPPWGIQNVWHYTAKTNATYTALTNANSYDLWAEIIVGGMTNVIGNWKR